MLHPVGGCQCDFSLRSLMRMGRRGVFDRKRLCEAAGGEHVVGRGEVRGHIPTRPSRISVMASQSVQRKAITQLINTDN